MACDAPPRVLFLGSTYVGHRTRFENLRAHTQHDPRIQPEYRTVDGWREGGRIERLALLPASLRGRLRALVDARVLVRGPRPDAIWTSAGDELLAAYAWAQLGRARRPLVMDADATPTLLEGFAELYYGRPARAGASQWLLAARRRLAYAQVSLFTAWSRWAAGGLVAEGVPADRIRVLPPGVDLGRWQPTPRRPGRPLRVLFVGGDFARKGGPELAEVVRSRFAGRIELDVVTRDPVAAGSGVRVHRAGPNSPELLSLYAKADLFALPSRAECFGIAAVEALASGLPVLMGDVGAAREIVTPGETGWIAAPGADSLAAALEAALARPDRLVEMGRRAREDAERRFDERRNARLLVGIVLEARERLAEERAGARRDGRDMPADTLPDRPFSDGQGRP